MDRDRRISIEDIRIVVFTCGVQGCDWTRKNMQTWEALKEYGVHFNSAHPNMSYEAASLNKQEVSSISKRKVDF